MSIAVPSLPQAPAAGRLPKILMTINAASPRAATRALSAAGPRRAMGDRHACVPRYPEEESAMKHRLTALATAGPLLMAMAFSPAAAQQAGGTLRIGHF